MNVLVTGGAGYIGSALISELARRDEVAEIVVYDNLSRGNRNFFLGRPIGDTPIHFVLGDVLDTRRLKKALDGVDVVVHLAAKPSVDFANEHPLEALDANVGDTLRVLLAAAEAGVPRLVCASSNAAAAAPIPFSQEFGGTVGT